MRILIDARLYGLEHAGIGRYVMNLIDQLQRIDKQNEYTVLLRKNRSLITNHQSPNFNTQIVDIPHYSLKEQLVLPQILSRLDFDLVHFPETNVPLFFNRPFVVTVHDLIKHQFKGVATTTKNPLLYWVKYAGYKIIFWVAIKRAKRIIVPSNAVNEELFKSYNIPQDKVVVIYEGVDEMFHKSQITNHKSQKILSKYKIKNPYLIYTGSAYPHKNLERLVQAVKCFNDLNHFNSVNLVIVSSRNVFLERVMEHARHHGAENFLHFLGFVPDEDLVVLYKNAKAFILPSLSEGFGLPGLEAMSAGCPVICSDIPVFHEIYGDAAIYFNQNDPNNIAKVILDTLSNKKLLARQIKKGFKQASMYSWQKMAKETLEVYSSLNPQVSS